MTFRVGVLFPPSPFAFEKSRQKSRNKYVFNKAHELHTTIAIAALMKELIEFCARVSTKYWLQGSDCKYDYNY